jgi:hypothetical protein
MMMIGSPAILVSRFLNSRLSKPGDEPKVQAEACDAGIFRIKLKKTNRKIL